jgi:hypothetical protein
MPSADFSSAIDVDFSTPSQFRSHATSQGTKETSRGKTQNLPRVNAGFIKHAHLRMEGFVATCPLAPSVPHLVSGSCSSPCVFGLGFLQTPPHDDPPQADPSPCLRLRENLAWGLPLHKFCAMPGTHGGHNRRGASRSVRVNRLVGRSRYAAEKNLKLVYNSRRDPISGTIKKREVYHGSSCNESIL